MAALVAFIGGCIIAALVACYIELRRIQRNTDATAGVLECKNATAIPDILRAIRDNTAPSKRAK